jgi:glutathione S-transferase
VPTLYHDPTSEPSRAVHWFTLAAGIRIELENVWLTRGEHRSARLLAVNPRHQVPALDDQGFHLSEATAIITYLAEVHGCLERWFGGTSRERARVNMVLSWYHTTVRLKLTLRYVLPLLLMPAYHGRGAGTNADRERARRELEEPLDQLEGFLGDRAFLCGRAPTAADLVLGSELFALDADPDRSRVVAGRDRLEAWLARLRGLPGYELSHAAWNMVAPLIRQRLRQPPDRECHPGWVADVCSRVVGGE